MFMEMLGVVWAAWISVFAWQMPSEGLRLEPQGLLNVPAFRRGMQSIRCRRGGIFAPPGKSGRRRAAGAARRERAIYGRPYKAVS